MILSLQKKIRRRIRGRKSGTAEEQVEEEPVRLSVPVECREKEIKKLQEKSFC